MKILHLCNDFCGSKVHACLYASLDKLGVEQTVYTYFKDENLNGRNQFEALRTDFVYCSVLKRYHSLFYHLKIYDVFNVLNQKLDVSSYDCVHAATLFSDGALAYKIKKQYNIPYVISVRNTDVNTFLNYAVHTWRMGYNILLNASRIVFISKALKKLFCSHPMVKRILWQIESKFVIQPNGIDDYWLQHIQHCRRENHNILYVGRLDYNKNVLRLIKAVLGLRKSYPDVKLNIVGDRGGQKEQILRLVGKYPNNLFYHGEIHDKNILRKMYCDNSIFAMLSLHETFGLVYIEALSQNMILLYSQNQGIDGLFDESIGEKVNPYSVRDIELKLRRVMDNYQAYSGNVNVDFSSFCWNKIALLYKDLYMSVLNNV